MLNFVPFEWMQTLSLKNYRNLLLRLLNISKFTAYFNTTDYFIKATSPENNCCSPVTVFNLTT